MFVTWTRVSSRDLWFILRTADESVTPVTTHSLPHLPDDLPLLVEVRGLLGEAELGDDGSAGLDGDTHTVNITAGDCI